MGIKNFLRTYWSLFIVAGLIVFLDQVSKSYIRENFVENMDMWAPWPWLLPYARIIHITNTGVAFGMFQGMNVIFAILASIVSLAIIYYYPRVPADQWLLRIALGLQLAGAVGNLIDRIIQGYVTDFISVGTFAVFNIADASITVGVAVLIFGVWLQEQREKKQAALTQSWHNNRSEFRFSRWPYWPGMNSETVQFIFREQREERLDKFLTTQMADFSRARLQSLVKEGQVKVNGKTASKAGLILRIGDQVDLTIPPTRPSNILPENIPLSVLFENDDLVVINKPAGMVVHPAAGHQQGTLVNAVLAHDPELEGIGGEQRPGIVHRLDKNTSGLILVAKNDFTLRWLQDQFRMRKVRKVYLALSDGHPPTPTGRIEAAIGRDPSQRKQMAIVSEVKGRSAVSEYRVLEQFPEHTFFEVHPETGRTHQIRLHLAMIGCPIVADKIYGHRNPSLPLERHFLHAARLTILLPGEETPRTFESPLPEDLQSILDFLRSR